MLGSWRFRVGAMGLAGGIDVGTGAMGWCCGIGALERSLSGGCCQIWVCCFGLMGLVWLVGMPGFWGFGARGDCGKIE